MFKTVLFALLAAGLASAWSSAVSEEPTQKSEPSPRRLQGPYIGPQLLTEEEQASYRASIRGAKTPREAEAIRAAHYELMKARAKEKGIALPDKRPPDGGGVGNVFGAQLMTEEERAAYRAKLRKANTKESVEKLRSEQHEKIEARTAERGVARPEAKAAKEEIQVGAKAEGSARAKTETSTGGGKAETGAGVLRTVFGEPLMSEEEQAAFRARLRAAKTEDERERIRAEHRLQLQARAKEKGVALPK